MINSPGRNVGVFYLELFVTFINLKLQNRIFFLFVTVILCLSEGSVRAQPSSQNKTLDSLKLAFKTAGHDTIRCLILRAMYIADSDPTKQLDYAQQRLQIAESNVNDSKINAELKKVFKNQSAAALQNMAGVYYSQNDIPRAIQYYNKTLKIYEEIGNKKGIAITVNYMGNIYSGQGDIAKALELLNRALKIKEEMDDKNGISQCLISIGIIYSDQGDGPKAMEYLNKSLKIQEGIDNKRGISACLINIGSFYAEQDDFPKALACFERTLKIDEEIGNESGISASLSNIGNIYFVTGNDSKALVYFKKSLKIDEEIKNLRGISVSLINIGNIYKNQANFPMALQCFKKSLALGYEIGFPERMRDAANKLYQVYKITGKHQLALENYELYIQMRDSFNNESTRKATIKSQLKYEYEKQAAADSVAHAKESEIKNVQLQKQTAEIKAKKNQQYALFGGLGLVMIFAGFMFNRFKVTQKQKGIIEHQKEIVEEQKKLVEEKQKEVFESIRYAKRIQMAQIPSEKMVNKLLERIKIK